MTTPTIVKGIPAAEIDVVWPMIEPLVDRMLRCRDHSLLDVKHSLQDERRQLFVTWPKLETICVTSIEVRPNSKVLILFGKAGRLLHDWRDMLAALEGWGRSVGCSAIEIRGRRGWQRLLPDYKASILLRKEL